MKRWLIVLGLVAAGCTRRGPRELDSGNPRADVAEPGGDRAGTHDGGAPDGPRVPATPTVGGRVPRELARAATRAIVTSRTHVFFGDGGDDALLAMPKAGGAPTRLARRAPAHNALALDGETLVWIATPGDVVLRVPASGGAPKTVREGSVFTDVTAAGGDVFFTEARGDGGTVSRVTGNTAARLASVEGSPRGIVASATHVYVATSTSLVAMPRTRGDVTVLATGGAFGSPQVDDAFVYATMSAAGRGRTLVRVARTGGAVESLATGVRDAAIALHHGTVYAIDAERPALVAIDTTGAAAASRRIVSEDEALEHVAALAVDDDGVFVGTGSGDGGRILRIAE